jgi:hypothetical protein
MREFLPPSPQKILSRTASLAEDVVLEKQIVAYSSDDPKQAEFQNEQIRHIEAVIKRQVELLRNPRYFKKLAEILEKTKNQKPKGRPTKMQSNSQPEETGWLAPQFDPWKILPASKTQESRNFSDDMIVIILQNLMLNLTSETWNGKTATPT